MYRVLLIDDERLALASLRRRIPWESCGFTVCGQACSAREGLEKIHGVYGYQKISRAGNPAQ